MTRPLALMIFAAFAAAAPAAEAVQAAGAGNLPQIAATSPVQNAIRSRLTELAGGDPVSVRLPVTLALPGQQTAPRISLTGGEALQRFYAARTHSPAWDGPDAHRRLQQLLAAIDDSARQGLRPAAYHRAFLQQALDTVLASDAESDFGAKARGDLDLAATDAFLTLARHYMGGQVQPQSFEPEWTIHAGPGDPVPLLNTAVQTGDIRGALRPVIPHQPGYLGLVKALSELRAMAEAGPWPVVPDGPSLKRGMFDRRVPILRARLIASGDLVSDFPLAGVPAPDGSAASDSATGGMSVVPTSDWPQTSGASGGPDDIETAAIETAAIEPAAIEPGAIEPGAGAGTDAQGSTAPLALPEIYDDDVVAAVLRFQQRHGLEPDGVVGPRTLAALNVPLADRIRQVELNMERWRWLPSDLGRRYVLVNIAGYDYRLIEDGVEKLYGRTIVGRKYRSTPVFSDEIEYLVFNPKWTVPRRLAVEDKLPRIKEDPDFLRREGFSVYVGWGKDAEEVMPEYVDWHSLSKNNFPYRLVQSPGSANALGRVKFLFPNKYAVYLHDTPSRHLFERAKRDFSSGCIRVEHPLELAEYLLSTEPGWGRDRIDTALTLDRERWIRLREPVPVHLLHWTAWRDSDGTLQFRNDLYGRDARLATALAHAAN